MPFTQFPRPGGNMKLTYIQRRRISGKYKTSSLENCHLISKNSLTAIILLGGKKEIQFVLFFLQRKHLLDEAGNSVK